MARKKNICRICLKNVNNKSSFSTKDIDPESKLEIRNILRDLNYQFPDEDCCAKTFCTNCTLKLFSYFQVRDEFCSIFLTTAGSSPPNACKTCGKEEQFKLICDLITFEDQQITLLELFTKLFSYDLNEKLIPTGSICKECYSKLHKLYSFHVKCVKAVEFWTDYIMEHYEIPTNLTASLHFLHRVFNAECIIGKLIEVTKCQVCSKQFPTALRLKFHMKNHKKRKETANNRVKCEQCNKTYSNVNYLRFHSRKMHQEQQLKCESCSKTFTDSSDLRKHLRLHSDNIRPYKCETCPKSFRQLNTLKVHMRVHSADKPYKCTICPSRFKAPQVLKKHLHRHNENQ